MQTGGRVRAHLRYTWHLHSQGTLTPCTRMLRLRWCTFHASNRGTRRRWTAYVYRVSSPHNRTLCLNGVSDHDRVHVFPHASISCQVELLLESRREAAPCIQRPAHHRGLQEARQLRSVSLCSAPVDQLSASSASVMRRISDQNVED